MPAGLDIEREQNINGSTAAYAEQVLISTGRSDWKSRIEDEEEGVVVRQLKALLGPRGRYSDVCEYTRDCEQNGQQRLTNTQPYHNVMLTNSSFAPSPSQHDQPADRLPTASAFLLPSFTYIPHIPTSTASIETLVRAFILPTQLHPSHSRLPQSEKTSLLRQPQLQTHFASARPVFEILILICGHGGRDTRCGTLGPILAAEFEDQLRRQGIRVLQDSAPLSEPETEALGTAVETSTPPVRIGRISHIGGHKWVGNVILYVPPTFERNALRGKGVWYGRVEPGSVEGIVRETVVGGKVIREMFRGGVGQGGEVLRL